MKAIGQTVGIDFTGKTDRYPNTTQAHVLLEYVKEKYNPQIQDKVSEALFQVRCFIFLENGILFMELVLINIKTE